MRHPARTFARYFQFDETCLRAGGAGKTALLQRFRDLALDAGVDCVRVDGRDVQATPGGFVAALAGSLDGATDPVEALATVDRAVLLVDTYESLDSLDSWLRENFLPRLPRNVLVVAAGRRHRPGGPTPGGGSCSGSSRCRTCGRRRPPPSCAWPASRRTCTSR